MKDTLVRMNRSELVQLSREAGLGNVSRDRSVSALVSDLLEDRASSDALEELRRLTQAHIHQHRARLLSQLPGCTGKCTTYGCPDLIVQRCWIAFSHDML